MATIDLKYTPEDILQILNDFYHYQSAFDPEVNPGEDLTFETTIAEWRDICNLLEYPALAKGYHDLFQLTTHVEELENVLALRKTTLSLFCHYIAEYAIKQSVMPVLMMGQSCMTASIFKTLTRNLKNRGVDIQNIRPSSKFVSLFDKHGAIFLEEVNKLAPGALSKFEYEGNKISKAGSTFLLFFLFTIVVVPIVWHFHWLFFVPLGIGIFVMYIGSKFSPAKEVIGGYDTVRDLIVGMQARM